MHRDLPALALALLMSAGTSTSAGEPKGIDSKAKAAELIRQADALSKSDEFDRALPLFVEASKLDGQAIMAFRGAGHALLQLNHPEEAIPYLKDALRIDSASSRPWENLGLAYSEIYDLASGELRRLSLAAPPGRVDPKNPSQQRMDALRAKLAEKDWRTEAIRAFREAVRLEPREAVYWYNLGTILDQYVHDTKTEAIDALLRALELDPTYYPALRNIALALNKQGRRSEAKEACLRMEKVAGPNDPAVVSLLGQIAYADRDLDEAERRFGRLLELDPDSKLGHIRLAEIYLRRGNMERSQEYTERAVALDPKHEKMTRWEIAQEK